MKLDILAALNAERQQRRPCALVTHLGTGEVQLVTAAALAMKPWAETEASARIAAAIQSGRSGQVELDGQTHFLGVFRPKPRLIVIGAVHISQAMLPMARTLGLDMTVVDPRTAFATPERFPDAVLIDRWPDEVLPELGLDPHTALAALTHDPKIDDPALRLALKAGCFYVGALGSRKTHAARLARLQQAGFSEDECAKIRAPIGLDIGAASPAEIALSVLAEVIQSLRKGAA